MNHSSKHNDSLFIEALSMHKQGKLERAKFLYDKYLEKNSNHFETLYLLGILAIQLNNNELAVQYLRAALVVNPDHADAQNNYGNLLQNDHKYNEAIQHYEEALKINPGYALAYFNRGNAMKALGKLNEALGSYEKAIELDSNYAEAHIHRGNLLLDMQQYKSSIASYDKSIEINPNIAQAYINRGNALQKLNKNELAIRDYNKAISINSSFAEAYLNKGNALLEIKKYEDAIFNFKKAIFLNPKIEYLLGVLINTCLYICEWEGLEKNKIKLVNEIREGNKVTPPFQLQSIVDNEEIQLCATRIWMKNKFKAVSNINEKNNNKIFKRNDKLKIGYFSGDFREHPVSFLTAGLFEEHDKSAFEIIAFDYGKDDQTQIRNRIVSAFDMFNCVGELTDIEIAKMANELSIDIAIDLSGLTHSGRPGIFMHRAALIQISYLGYLGSMGSDVYDYIFADNVLIPENSQKYYHENIIYLPNYQINNLSEVNTNLAKIEKVINLPNDKFVYCCFNNTYKINPQIFEVWMRILEKVPESVLLLYVDNNSAEKNLQIEAEKRGIEKQRLIFCRHIDRDRYLERFELADLFLDTLPYNAGTTASDALWAGLPVLTCKGNSFASRMAASLISSLEINELITSTIEEYENMAIELGNNPIQLRNIKNKLKDKKINSLLFKTKEMTKKIEKAYVEVWERKKLGKNKENIYIR